MALKAIYICAFFFVEVLLGFLNMADFPPNLEDGERWLPADIYHEIVYGSFEPKALADNTSGESATEVWNEPINSSFDFSSELFFISFLFLVSLFFLFLFCRTSQKICANNGGEIISVLHFLISYLSFFFNETSVDTLIHTRLCIEHYN